MVDMAFVVPSVGRGRSDGRPDRVRRVPQEQRGPCPEPQFPVGQWHGLGIPRNGECQRQDELASPDYKP
jgi:hypothetical protein